MRNLRQIGQAFSLLILSLLLILGWMQLKTLQAVATARMEMAEKAAYNRNVPTIIPTKPHDIPPAQQSEAEASTRQTFDLSNVPILQDTSIIPAFNPRTFQGKRPTHETFETYVVERGDTPIRIAESFGVDPETLLGGNPKLSEEAGALSVGDEIIILPIDGVLHDVKAGDSLESLSELYGIPVEAIIDYKPNNLEFPYRLYTETQILVPGAKREVFQWDAPSLSTGGSYWGGQAQPQIVGSGSFVWPISGGNITQVFWPGHPALDVGMPEGAGVFAADTGTVTYASFSPYCYGNLIVINHGNGFETFYAHLSGINVVPGQIVYKGNVIGAVGNTGCSSGPHIHFEVRINGRRDDPVWWLP